VGLDLWDLIIGIATLLVATTGTTLVLLERNERRSRRGLATRPQPRWRVVEAPSAGTLPIETSNVGGAAAPHCFVVMHAGSALYTGNFSLSEEQSWTPEELRLFETVEETSVPTSLICVAGDVTGHWIALGPNTLMEWLIPDEVPHIVSRLLRRATGRPYACEWSSGGDIRLRRVESGGAPETVTAPS